MDLENYCNSSCSSLDTTGCEIISHEEVERQLDKALKYTFKERYQMALATIADGIRIAYNFFR